MKLTLLFDLDDTLLGNSMDVFIPAYLRALSGAMASLVPPDKMIPALMTGVQAMSANTDLRKTLKQVFNEAFYPPLDLDPHAAQPHIEKFYAAEFPSLDVHTRQLPGAPQLVQNLFAAGHTLAVSTNPLFPATAIHQRLDWAGLPPTEFPFSVITAMELNHFTKPSPAYFAEVLAWLGWPNGPIVIIGDDPENDIQPAHELGIASYQVTNSTSTTVQSGPGGPLENLESWLATQTEDSLTPRLDTLFAVLATLRTSHSGVFYATTGQDETRLNTRPAASEWSITEILCHFRDVDLEVTLPRLEAILTEDNPFIPAANPDEWAADRNYQSENPATVLDQWLEVRHELMTRLDALTTEEWHRTGRHTLFGPISLLELMRINARHDRLHIQQIHATLARMA